MVIYKLDDLYILDDEGELSWIQKIEDKCFVGKCTILNKIDTLLILPYDKIKDGSNMELKQVKKWDKTEFFAMLSETANINFFEVDSLQRVSEEKETVMRENLGCTSKYLKS